VPNPAPKVSDSGLVYRNPKPNLRSIVAYHPSLVLLKNDEVLCTFDVGEAVESLDYHTVAARSTNLRDWSLGDPLLSSPPPHTSHSVRTSRLSDGSLIGFGGLWQRNDPDAGLLNPETFGYVPMDLIQLRSNDGGRRWTAPEVIEPPFTGPSWETCHAILELDSGRLLAPTSTWRAWNGENPSGDQAVVLISEDGGKTWPAFGRSFDGRESGLTHFEQSVVQMQDGRLLAVSWVYDMIKNENYPTEYAISRDRGETFSPPMHNGLVAQTCKLCPLADGRIFAAYRRSDAAGLWGAVVGLEGGQWMQLAEAQLWTGADTGMRGEKRGADELSALKFGYPSAKQLPSGEVLVVFWCREACITNIRWLLVEV